VGVCACQKFSLGVFIEPAPNGLELLPKFKLLALTAGSVCSGYAEWIKGERSTVD